MRLLLKLSGESLAGAQGHGIDQKVLAEVSEEIIDVIHEGAQLGIVVGGGNLFRGLSEQAATMDRVRADHMGMLATVMNGLALQDALLQRGQVAQVMTPFALDGMTSSFSAHQARALLAAGTVVIFSGGTGNPFFTTDTAASLRALEIEADFLCKATRVDGVYTADPEKDPGAKFISELTAKEAIGRGLKIMDGTAFNLCQANRLDIVVFSLTPRGNLLSLVKGERLGTLVRA